MASTRATQAGATSGLLTGAKLGSYFGPMGTVIGGIGGALTGGLFGKKDDDAYNKKMSDIRNKLQEGIEGLTDKASGVKDYFDKLRNMADEETALINESAINKMLRQNNSLFNTAQNTIGKMNIANPQAFNTVLAQAKDNLFENYKNVADRRALQANQQGLEIDMSEKEAYEKIDALKRTLETDMMRYS
tara:strand:+ start:1027 stop:1593 length:567 start_codon:yes stop_codon:yes gene_type:complete